MLAASVFGTAELVDPADMAANGEATTFRNAWSVATLNRMVTGPKLRPTVGFVATRVGELLSVVLPPVGLCGVGASSSLGLFGVVNARVDVQGPSTAPSRPSALIRTRQ